MIASTAPYRRVVPSSRPRSVWITGVNGWYSANQRSQVGIVSVGTNPLPSNGNSITNIGVLLALSTLLETSPSATINQVTAKVKTTRTPIVAGHSAGFAVGRNPINSAIAVITSRSSRVWTMLPIT